MIAPSVIEQRLRDCFIAALAGDNGAYAAFLTQGSALVRGYLRRRLASRPDDIEDLVQDVLLAIHNRRHTYEPSAPLTPWLYAIARYKLFDALRADGQRRSVEQPIDDVDEDDAALVAAGGGAAEARRDLGVLLATLPDRYRLPIVHVKLEGLSVDETARRTGLSTAAVKVNVHRGLKRLAATIAATPATKRSLKR